MVEPLISKTEEDMTGPHLNQERTHRIFRHPQFCISITFPLGPVCQSKILLQRFEEFEREHPVKWTGSVKREGLDSRHQYILPPGSPPSFFTKTTRYRFRACPICQS